MKATPFTKQLLSVLLGLAVLTVKAPAATAQNAKAIEARLESLCKEGSLKGAAWGFMARDTSGNVIGQYNAGTRLVPASNLKLVTTGAALHAFGPEYRFQTQLGYTGNIDGGTLEGDLYILGGGDPTLGAKDSIAYAPDALFWKWKTILKEAGIERIHGRIVGDGSSWEGHLEHPSWGFADMGTYYGAGEDALSFYQNAIDFSVEAAAAPGEPVKIQQLYPKTPWMQVQNQALTASAGTGNSLYLYTTDLAPYAELRGTFAIDRRPKTEHFANKYGALTCAYYFWKNLKDTGWEVTGGYARVNRSGYLCGPDFVPGPKAEIPTVIGHTDSPTLSQIVRITNTRSDNFYAESCLKAMGEAATQIAVYDSCLVAARQVLEGLGLEPEGLRQADGSGLSRENFLSAQWMVDFLDAMRRSPAFPAFLSSLPHPGEGTLAGSHLAPERYCFKSGSMGGVLCYSGYVLDAQGQPVVTFSLLTNNTVAPKSAVRTALERLIGLLGE